MKKSYIKCPYCQDEVSVSGSSMHVRNKHTDKYEEFKKNFAEIKKTAVIKESATRTEVSGPEPPRIEEKEKPPESPKEPPKEPEKYLSEIYTLPEFHCFYSDNAGIVKPLAPIRL